MDTNNGIWGEECKFDDSHLNRCEEIVTREMLKAYECKAYARDGDMLAQYQLAERYYKGKGIEQDYDEAEYWYYQSAKQGYALSQYRLGMVYQLKTLSVPDYIGMAVKWLTLAAEQHLAKAQYELGMIYAAGYYMAKDYDKSFPLFSKAAAMGNRDAMYCMGLSYRIGAGVEKNLAQSAEWYRKAAARGMRIANDQFYDVMHELMKSLDDTDIKDRINE